MIILPFCHFEDVAYSMYETDGIIAVDSEYGFDVYANSLEKLSSKTTLYEDTILRLCGT